MHDLHAVDIACGKFVKGYDILGIVVFDFKQICNLSVGFLRQIAAHLHIDTLKAHAVFQHCGNGFRVKAHHTVFQRSVRKIEFFLCFQHGFPCKSYRWQR